MAAAQSNARTRTERLVHLPEVVVLEGMHAHHLRDLSANRRKRGRIRHSAVETPGTHLEHQLIQLGILVEIGLGAWWGQQVLH